MRTTAILFSIFLSSICWGQTDSMLVALSNGVTKSYSIPSILQVSFSGVPTSVKERELIQHVLSSFSLRQNFPNPFNPTTTIQYEIPHSGIVQVDIYDIRGRLIRSLLRSKQEAGKYALVWDGRSSGGLTLPSGAYFCRVLFDGNLLTTKLSLIK